VDADASAAGHGRGCVLHRVVEAGRERVGHVGGHSAGGADGRGQLHQRLLHDRGRPESVRQGEGAGHQRHCHLQQHRHIQF